MTSALQGALRLEGSPARKRGALGGDVGSGGGDANYYNKLITLFPAEALTLYMTGVAVFGRSTLGAMIACTVLLAILRWVATQPRGGGAPQYPMIAVALLSFILWTSATDPRWLGDLQGGLDLGYIQKWAAFLGAAFVLLAPAIVPADPVGSDAQR